MLTFAQKCTTSAGPELHFNSCNVLCILYRVYECTYKSNGDFDSDADDASVDPDYTPAKVYQD